MANLKSQVNDREAAAIRKRLATWARESNPCCADCGRANPSWASVNLGVLVCLECAGRHRGLGVHVSKMRSITLDTVLPQEARFLLYMTNDMANRWWEAKLSAEDKGAASASAAFVEQKYSQRKWALQDSSIPQPSQSNVPDAHPWVTAQSAAPQSAGTTVHTQPQAAQPPRSATSAGAHRPHAPPVAGALQSGSARGAGVPAPAATREASLIDLDGSSPRPAAVSDAFDPFAVPETSTSGEAAHAAPKQAILQPAQVCTQGS